MDDLKINCKNNVIELLTLYQFLERTKINTIENALLYIENIHTLKDNYTYTNCTFIISDKENSIDISLSKIKSSLSTIFIEHKKIKRTSFFDVQELMFQIKKDILNEEIKFNIPSRIYLNGSNYIYRDKSRNELSKNNISKMEIIIKGKEITIENKNKYKIHDNK
jgi:hypothetical protein